MKSISQILLVTLSISFTTPAISLSESSDPGVEVIGDLPKTSEKIEVIDNPTESQQIIDPSFETGRTKIETASKRDMTLAAAHWSRARSLIINGLNEFDQGSAKVDPSALLDVDEWRNSLLERIRELEIVLNPQPRDSITGIKLPANRNLLGNIEEIEKKVKGIQ